MKLMSRANASVLALAVIVGAGLISSCSTPAAFNPANCTVKAHDPHESYHQPGKINAEVRQTCPVSVPRNSAEAQLWEKRIWGYDRIGTKGFSNLRTRKVSSAFANAGCRNNSIRVTGYGHYEWKGQHVQSAEVSNTKHVNC